MRFTVFNAWYDVGLLSADSSISIIWKIVSQTKELLQVCQLSFVKNVPSLVLTIALHASFLRLEGDNL